MSRSRKSAGPRKKSAPAGARGYALTPWSRAFVDVVEGRDLAGQQTSVEIDTRRITQARRYFRDRHVHGLRISSARVTASVAGTQLDPFDVTLTMRAVHADTVAALLRTQQAVGDLMNLARGEQPRTLGELIAPTDSADIVADCTCPDSSSRCIHVLSTAYEVAAEIDRTPTTLLTVMGTDLPSLLAAVDDRAAAGADTEQSGRQSEFDETPLPGMSGPDHYGTGAVLPPAPSPAPVDPLMELDVPLLRIALRASGVAPGDVAEAMDQLGDLYDRLRRPSNSTAGTDG